MYDYEFVTVKLNWWSKKPQVDYHEIISEYTENGWRLVQVFAPPISGYGSAAYFELIFERAR